MIQIYLSHLTLDCSKVLALGRARFIPVLVILMLLVMALPPSITTAGPVVRPGPESAPLTTKPTGQGPYKVGYTYENLTFTTKTYKTQIKAYYPALTGGQNTTGNLSGAPYPTIVWFPGTCCTTENYIDVLVGMASWGLVVVTVGLESLDYQHSGNVSDLQELLDHLEGNNVTPTAILYQMVDKEAFGLSGHSSGGALALIDAPFVDRIKAVEPVAAAITHSTVNYLAGLWHKPVLCQVGAKDYDYGNGCNYVFDLFPTPKSEAIITSADHFGPFQLHLFVTFYYYYLKGKADYWTYLYGEEAINDVAAGTYLLKFKTSATNYFPPTVHASVAWPEAPMDHAVPFTGDIQGYFIPNHPQSRLAWDFDNDGTDDYQDQTDANLTHAFTEPGIFAPVLNYRIGPATYRCVENLTIDVTDVPPVALAGPDMLFTEDAVVIFNASRSHDTVSDNATLMFRWDFGDGNVTDFESSPSVTHAYVKAGVYQAGVEVMDRHGVATDDGVTVMVTNVAPTAIAGDDLTFPEDKEVTLTGAGSDTPSDVPGLKFRWDLGDGNKTDWSGSPVVKHIYTKEGNHTATFFVKDIDGLEVNSSLVVRVFDIAPLAQISSPMDGGQFQMDQVIQFRGWGCDTASDMPHLKFRWDFGDDNVTAWSDNGWANYSYIDVGIYDIMLEIIDDEGSIARAFAEITIVDVRPGASIVTPDEPPYISEDDTVEFVGKGTDTPSDLPRLHLRWDIEGAVYDGATVRHTFGQAGTYTAVLTVTDPSGRNATASIMVHVYNVAPTLTAKIEPLVVIIGQKVNFSVVANDTPSDLGTIKTTWDFGDMGSSTSASGSHTYSAGGTYTMTVTVIDDDGEKATETYTVTVLKPTVTKPPPKKVLGRDPLGLEVGLVALVVIGVVLMALSSKERPAPVKAPPKASKPVGRTKKGHKAKKRTKSS